MTHEMPLVWVLGPMAGWFVAALIALNRARVPNGSLSAIVGLSAIATSLAVAMWMLGHCQGASWYPDTCAW
jgi:hypothetical protein